MLRLVTWHLISLFACLPASVLGQTREEKVRNDLARFQLLDGWLYNNIEQGFLDAKKSGKPVMVVLRCVPCEECVKLDDDVIEQHPTIRTLLGRFVRVRQIATNGIDLRKFQFDYDQSFTVMFFNADGTIYGRYGTRSHRTEWVNDVSVEGLAKAMSAVLKLHENFDQVRPSLAAKTGREPPVQRPEQFPNHVGRFASKLDYEGKVDRSCIHCHQVGESLRDVVFKRDGRLSDELLFPYPHPKILGLMMDPKEAATIRDVLPRSIAERSGLRPGDRIVAIEDQPPISIADLQWVLHHLPNTSTRFQVRIDRDNQQLDRYVDLPDDWKALDDLSWRATTWELRRIALGGLLLKELSNEERASLSIPKNTMALRVEHVGKYPPHNEADKAGVQTNDIVVQFLDRSDLLRETDVIRHSLHNIRPNDAIRVELLRQGRKISASWKKPKS